MRIIKLAKSVVFMVLLVNNLTNCMSENDNPGFFLIPASSSQRLLPATNSPIGSEAAATLQSIQEAVRTRMQQAAEERRATQSQIQRVLPQLEAALQSSSSSLVRTIIERFFLRTISLEELHENLPVSYYPARLMISAAPEQRISSNQLRLIGKKFPRITELDVSGTGLGNEGLAELAQQPYATRLTHLNISRNSIRWEAIRAHIGAFASLTSLDISNNFVQDAGLVAIAQQSFARNLTYLNIRSTGILLGTSASLAFDAPKITADKIRASLNAFKSLKRLNISNNSIRNAGFELLAQSSFASYLTDLNISDDQINTVGIENNIGVFEKLTTLNISANSISDQGLDAIARQPFASNLTLDANKTDVTQVWSKENCSKFKVLKI